MSIPLWQRRYAVRILVPPHAFFSAIHYNVLGNDNSCMGIPFTFHIRAPDKRGIENNSKDIFSYFSMKTYIVIPH